MNSIFEEFPIFVHTATNVNNSINNSVIDEYNSEYKTIYNIKIIELQLLCDECRKLGLDNIHQEYMFLNNPKYASKEEVDYITLLVDDLRLKLNVYKRYLYRCKLEEELKQLHFKWYKSNTLIGLSLDDNDEAYISKLKELINELTIRIQSKRT